MKAFGAIIPLVLSLAAGCNVMREARIAQKGIEGKAAGEASAVKPCPDLGGNLETLVAFALENRPSMASARIAVEDSRLALKEIASNAPLASRTPWNAVDASASIGHSESSTPAHFKDMKSKTDGSASASLSIDVLLWDFGRNDADYRAQAERVLAAELDLVRTGYAVFNEVAAAYFSRLQEEALLAVAFTNETMRAEHLKRAEEMLDAGEAQKLDVLRAKLDLAEAEEAIVAASNSLVAAEAKLANALGLEASCRKNIVSKPVSLDQTFRAFDDTEFLSEEMYAFARTNAPAMQIARARLRAASFAVDRAVSDLMPSVSASFGLNWADPLWYWRWGVSAAQSLFTGFRKTTAVERAVAAMDSAATEVDAAELDLSLNIEIAINERDNAREAVATALASVHTAQENFETVRGQFLVGDASRVDFTDAAADYVTALANYIKAFYRGQIAEAKLFELGGVEPVYE